MTDSLQHLATLVHLGIASASQTNELAERSIRICIICVGRACKCGKIRKSDIDDVVQDAIIRAFKYIERWNAARSKWITYLSIITASSIGEQQRKYLQEKNIEETALRMIDRIESEEE